MPQAGKAQLIPRPGFNTRERERGTAFARTAVTPGEDLSMATLCLLNIDGALVAQWEITDHPVTVGRGASANIRIEDDGLSRRHFMVVHEDGDYLIRDLSSRNGTWVHGQRAVSTRLSHNDCILAGHMLFRFCEDRAVVCSTPQGEAAAS
jgi:pSer/pThr/pTyr-binding forkhead associated (FHA) protein